MTTPGEEAVLHKVARGEYLFKILRHHGYGEVEAQMAMNLMAKDPQGFGITSGNVHVMYPGDVVRLPPAASVQTQMAAEFSQLHDAAEGLATKAPPAALSAAHLDAQAILDRHLGETFGAPHPVPSRGPLEQVFSEPSVEPRPERVAAARELLEDGGLHRLNELLTLFDARVPPPSPTRRPGAPPPAEPLSPAERSAPPMASYVLPPNLAPDTSRPATSPPPTPARPAGPPRSVAPRPALRPRPNRSFMDRVPRYGQYFTPQQTDEEFNVYRPFQEPGEMWFRFHRCPSCAAGSARLCITLKFLAMAEIWDAVLDPFSLSGTDQFDTQL